VEVGAFRDDLFYRLNVLPLHMPALRERGNDISLMAAFFLRNIAEEFKRDITGFAPEALEVIQSYSWPGNVREMIACIRRAVVMSMDRLISVADLAITPRQAAPLRPLVQKLATPRLPPGSELEREALRRALERHNHNVTRASAEMGVSRVTFYRMLKRHNCEH